MAQPLGAPGPLPWLRYRQIEVANAARTMAYINRGLVSSASGVFEVAPSYPCGVLYRDAGVSGPSGFVSPAADPAPWYSAEFVESADFLGFIPTEILGLDSVMSRSTNPRLGGIQGGQLGPQQASPRLVTVQGTIVAASPAGAEYGIRWLTAVLSASDCNDCEVGPLEVRAWCPSDVVLNDLLGHYTLYDVGLTGGPKDVAHVLSDGRCDIRDIELTLVAENPYLYRDPVECLAAEVVGQEILCGSSDAPDICTWLFGPPGPQHCCQIVPPTLGSVGSIITIHGGASGVGGLTIGLYVNCPPGPSDAAVKKIEIEGVPPNGVLVIDSAQEKIVLTVGGVSTDGTGLLLLPAGEAFEWITAAPCDSATCICVQTSHPCSGGASATVEIQAQLRER